MSYFHSVTLDHDKCHGCTNCIKHCPTEAIRVRNGKAKIIKERCIDCGECIRVCPYHAKKAITDSLDDLQNFKYTVALPAPSLYGQFRHTDDHNRILTALLGLGFSDVYEVARGAEISSHIIRTLLQEGKLKKPAISSACPAVVRLIRERFPDLIENMIPVLAPMEIAAREARKEAREKTLLPDEDIGVFFITPCPAKVTAIKAPIAIEKSAANGAIAVKDIYPRLRSLVKDVEEIRVVSRIGAEGLAWARSGGESEGAQTPRYIAVDGIHRIIGVLEMLEDDRLDDIDFVELCACDGGCVGGPLHVANAFVASTRMKNMEEKASDSVYVPSVNMDELYWSRKIEHEGVMRLADSVSEAMKKLEEIDRLCDRLPGLDCGSCGAPSCRAFAEDIVRGFNTEDSCIIKMREKIKHTEAKSDMP